MLIGIGPSRCCLLQRRGIAGRAPYVRPQGSHQCSGCEARRSQLVSRCTQMPENALSGTNTALNSRNLPSCLYSNPGQKPMQAKRLVSSLYLYPGQTLAETSSGFMCNSPRHLSAVIMQSNPGKGLKTNKRDSGN
jgi:hypothetical protein